MRLALVEPLTFADKDEEAIVVFEGSPSGLLPSRKQNAKLI